MFGRPDRFEVGNIGFAQVGMTDYLKRLVVEKKVMRQILRECPKLHIPESLQSYVRYKWFANPHDFGTYHSFEVIVNSDVSDPDEEDDFFMDLSNKFYHWYNELESFDWEIPEYEERCREMYKPSMDVIHGDEDPTELRIVD